MAIQGLTPYQPQPARQVEIRQDIPAYKIVEKRGFFDDSDHLWPKDSMIYWEGRPSSAFEPLNELAEQILRDYFVELERLANEVSKQKGMGHASLVNAYESRRRIAEMDRKAGRSVDRFEEARIMGGKKHEKKRAYAVQSGVPQDIPMMGHQARSTALRAQTGSDRDVMNNQTGDKSASSSKSFI